MTADTPTRPAPALAGLVAHWHNESELAELVSAWPTDPRFELVIVDNASDRGLARGSARLLSPGRNLGFAGAINLALAESRAPLVLLLNPDAAPEAGALDSLLEGFAAQPEAAGLAPALVGPDGRAQHDWQLRSLPTPLGIVGALLLPERTRRDGEPRQGALVEQPAAAALALRRDVLIGLGGLDESFYPAWFEDVDLAYRLRAAGHAIVYWPAARFRHGRGASLPKLGYGTFLWAYYRNMLRYLRKHHGAWWAAVGRCLLPAGLALRTLALAFGKPERARSRSEAARGLAGAALGAISNWRRPLSTARRVGGWSG